MDPDVALSQARAAIINADRDALVEHFQALDEWLTRGGFLPQDWLSARTAPLQPRPVDHCLECGADVALVNAALHERNPATIAAQFEHVSTDGQLVRLSHRPVLTRPIPGNHR